MRLVILFVSHAPPVQSNNRKVYLSSEIEKTHLYIQESVEFRNRTLRYEKILKDIDEEILEFQTRKLTLSDCRIGLESL